MRCKASFERPGREQENFLDTGAVLGREAVDTLAALEDQQEIVSDMGQSSRQEQAQHHFDRTSVQDFERRMRQAVDPSGRTWEVWERLVDSGRAGPAVGVVAANTVEMGPACLLILIFVPDSSHWPCSYPLSEFARSRDREATFEEVVVTWSSWFACGRRAFAAVREKRRS